MTHRELMEQLKEMFEEDEGPLVLEPRADYDQFIMGLAERGGELVVLYDKPALLDWLATVAGESDDGQDPSEAAQEHFGFNMSQAGPGYPMYVDILVDTPIWGPDAP